MSKPTELPVLGETNPQPIQGAKPPVTSRRKSSKQNPRYTRRIVIQQEALRHFVARVSEARRKMASEIDMIDAALLDHVAQRLTIRRCQKVRIHSGVLVVWVHMPTLVAENWLLKLGPDALSRRFKRLVDIGLLVRLHVPLGSRGGSRVYFGFSQAWRSAVEDQETVQRNVAATLEQHCGNSGATLEQVWRSRPG